MSNFTQEKSHQVFRGNFNIKVSSNYKQDTFHEYAKILFQIDQQQQTLFSTLSRNKLISIRRLNKQKYQKTKLNTYPYRCRKSSDPPPKKKMFDI